MALPSTTFPDYGECNYPTSLETEKEDNSIQTEMSNGTVKTRPWSTKTRTTFNIEFSTRTLTEANVLEDFYDEVQMYTPFTFTHPTKIDSDTGDYKQYAVRFSEPITITQDGSKPFVKDISMVLVEV